MEGRAPSHWAQSPSPRKAAEQVFPKSHLTMYAKVRFFYIQVARVVLIL